MKAAALAHYREQAAQAIATAHTPGPWKWDGTRLRPADPDPDKSAVHTILDDEGGGGGFLGKEPWRTNAELAADYRLIAAAPLLLDALQRLLSQIDRDAPTLRETLGPSDDDEHTTLFDACWSGSLAAARAAIDAATRGTL